MEQNQSVAGRTKDFRLLIQHELLTRCQKNPSYSLRAFAKSLSVSPSALSDMINGKRPITPKMKERLGLAMGLELEEIREYQTSSSDNRESQLKNVADFQQLTLDTFAIISDWYHYAILELMKVKGFKNDASWISKILGISKIEASAAVERLIRVGLIEVKENGQWQDTSSGFSTNIIDRTLTSAGSKKLQKQILELSIKALEELSPDVRNHTSMTMAINPKDLPDAVEKIRIFRRSLCEFLERDKNPTQVFHLGISLYPVSVVPEGDQS